MKQTMSRLLPALALLAPLTLPAPAAAMGSTAGPQAQKTAAQAHPGQGTVNRVDAAAGKVNITHGPIPSLGWSGMTMDFQVQNKADLARIKPGQQVNFEVTKSADGRYLITRITPATR